MKHWRFIFPFLFLISTLATAQTEETLFSAKGIRLTGAWAGPIIAGTMVNKKTVSQTGASFALEFNKNLRVGWRTNAVDFPKLDSINANIDFSYSGLFFNYAPASHKAIHPTFELFGGAGNMGFEAQDDQNKEDIWVAQPEIGLEINTFRWLKLGIAGGYRFAFFVGDEFEGLDNNNLSSPYAQIALRFGFSWGERE